MDPVRMDLVSLRRPVEIQFPNEQWYRIEPFRAHGKALLLQWQNDPQNAALLLELLRLAVPAATPEAIESLSLEEDVPRVLAAADGKARQMEEYLKNVASDGAERMPSPTPPSSPMTGSSGSSGTLPEATASPGSASTTPPITKPSSPSPPSRTSSASNDSNRKTGTSTTTASP